MDADKELSRITDIIKDGDYESAKLRTRALADARAGESGITIKCASVMKVIGDEDGCGELLSRLLSDLPEEPSDRFEVLFAIGMLGMPAAACDGMEATGLAEDRPEQYGRILMMSGRHVEALEALSGSDTAESGMLRADTLRRMGRYEDAVSESKALTEEDDSYDAAVSYCTSLISAGREKEAVAFAKSRFKEDKRNVDSLALMAYVMRLEGKLPAAVNYGNRALRTGPLHIGALETMAMCLVEKGDTLHAKIFAGVINQRSPGHPAAIRILDACNLIS